MAIAVPILKKTTNRKLAFYVATSIIVLIVLETISQNYVAITHLPIVNESDARIPGANTAANGSYVFSSSGGRWIALWWLKEPSPSVNYVEVFIFKLQENKSLSTLSVDFAFSRLQVVSNISDGYLNAFGATLSFYSDYALVSIEYDVGLLGTYHADFGLTLMIYQRTLIGLVQQGEVRIPVAATIVYKL